MCEVTLIDGDSFLPGEYDSIAILQIAWPQHIPPERFEVGGIFELRAGSIVVATGMFLE